MASAGQRNGYRQEHHLELAEGLVVKSLAKAKLQFPVIAEKFE